MPVLAAARPSLVSIQTAVGPHRDILRIALVAFVAALMAAASAAHLHGYVPDDAFITYRIAANVAAGEGWTYNAGETTGNGATSPLYTALLALGGLVYAGMPRLGTLVFVLGIAAAATCTYEMLRRLGHRAAAWLAVPFVSLNPWLSWTRGMETGMFLGFTAGTLLSVLAGRMFLAGVLAGSTALVRGEGVLLCAIIGLHAIWVGRRIPWRLIAGGVTVGLPWIVYSWIALGSVVPDTLAAKIAQTRSGFWGEGWLFLTDWWPLLQTSQPLLLWGIATVGFAVVGASYWYLHGRPNRVIVYLALFTGGFVLAYGVALNVPNYHWYYGLPVYFLSVLAAVGAGHLWEVGRERLDTLHLAAGVMGAVAIIGFGWLGFPQGANGTHYAAIGQWLEENTEPDARIAATEIGYIGWYADRPIIDYLGLISTDSTEELREGDLVSWVERENPDYWVRWHPPMAFEEDLSAQIWFDHAFDETYRHVAHLGVYERVRPLDEARALGRDELAEDAEVLADVITDDGTDGIEEAVRPLLRLVAEHRDLYTTFVDDDVLQTGPMIEWARSAGTEEDPRRDELAAHQDIYATLRTAGSDAEVPVEDLSVLGTDLHFWWEHDTWPATTTG